MNFLIRNGIQQREVYNCGSKESVKMIERLGLYLIPRANNRTNSNGRNNRTEVITFRVTYVRTVDGEKRQQYKIHYPR